MGGGRKDKAAQSNTAPRNAIAAGTISVLLSSQLSPDKKADSTERRRVQSALDAAHQIPDTRQLSVKSTTGVQPQIVLFRGGSLAAAEWAADCLSSKEFAGPANRSGNEGWGKPVALDFASDSNPGGGWRGQQQGTQEEELCRATSLGLALERLAARSGHYAIPQHGCIYVDDVAVIRNPDGSWRHQTLWCAVIAAALRNADGNQAFIQQKVAGVLGAAAGHGAFIGGAWGCGAFGNDAADMAEAWRVAAKRAPPDLALLVLALPSKQIFDVFRSTFPNAGLVQPEQTD